MFKMRRHVVVVVGALLVVTPNRAEAGYPDNHCNLPGAPCDSTPLIIGGVLIGALVLTGAIVLGVYLSKPSKPKTHRTRAEPPADSDDRAVPVSQGGAGGSGLRPGGSEGVATVPAEDKGPAPRLAHGALSPVTAGGQTPKSQVGQTAPEPLADGPGGSGAKVEAGFVPQSALGNPRLTGLGFAPVTSGGWTLAASFSF